MAMGDMWISSTNSVRKLRKMQDSEKFKKQI